MGKRVGDRGRRTLAATAGLILLTLLGLTSSGAGAAGGGAGSRAVDVQVGKRFVTGATAQTMSYREARETWTPERIAAAKPLAFPADGELTTEAARPQPLVAATPFASTIIDDTTRYPNRVHGKMVGTFPGIGDFACSANVAISTSASLLTTAGHCVYDPFSRTAATDLAFVPAYDRGAIPYGVWPVTNFITTGQWAKRASLDYDFAMMRIILSPFGGLQSIIGSRGIAFDQPLRQRYDAFGYPTNGAQGYDGERMVKCNSGLVPDRINHGGPQSVGMRCDMQQGASGGGLVIQNSALASVVSHGHVKRGRLVAGRLYGPSYGAVAKAMYKADLPGWPSIGPIGCLGKTVTIAGTLRQDKLEGTPGRDVIASLGGNDRIKGRGGRDLLCGGEGPDRIIGGGGKDRIDGGDSNDRCGGAKGNDKLINCEVRRKPRVAG